MKFRVKRFNIYLCTALALGLFCGCHTTREKQDKKRITTLRLHMETNPDAPKRSGPVTIHGITFNLESEPFLTEAHVKEAKVIDVVGGFEMSIQMDRQGSWLLEQYTSAGRGKHLAVFSQWTTFPEKKLNKGRWLASLFIRTHITDGLLTFTPDVTREEADQIATGLNNVAKQIQENSLTD
jgi:hypothetical protein